MSAFDPVRTADALCDRPGRAEFLSVDLDLVRALEDTLEALPGCEVARRARVAARLALELRSDPTTFARRRALLASARADAARAAEAAASVEAELAGVHALWESAAASDRLDAADRAVAAARAGRLAGHELEARMARVDSLMGLGRLGEAEVELATYTGLAPPDDRDCRLFAASRRAALYLLRGRFEEAERSADVVAEVALTTDRGDAQQVLMTVRGCLARERGNPAWSEVTVQAVVALVERLPGQHHEAILARMLLELGRTSEARVELARAVASLRAGRGPMWLAALYDAAMVAAEVGRNTDREWLLTRLDRCGSDFAGYAFWFCGSVHAARGALALALGRAELALEHLDRAVADLEAIGAIPPAARARALRARILRELGRHAAADSEDQDVAETAAVLGLGDLRDPSTGSEAWSLVREADGWRLAAGPEHARLPHSRGLEHLRALLANPRHEVAAVVLEAGGEELPPPSLIESFDAAARDAYRARLDAIDAELDAAERRGDPVASANLVGERAALVAELRRGLGLGGRPRRDPDATERARINVTRSIRRAVDRIGQVAPRAGLHLAASVRTGTFCRYEPAAGGPAAWRLH